VEFYTFDLRILLCHSLPAIAAPVSNLHGSIVVPVSSSLPQPLTPLLSPW
jgi:hypothetical protein